MWWNLKKVKNNALPTPTEEERRKRGYYTIQTTIDGDQFTTLKAALRDMIERIEVLERGAARQLMDNAELAQLAHNPYANVHIDLPRGEK